MGNYKNKAYPLRVDETLMKKVSIIAERENRTRNKQIEHILLQSVAAYEVAHGPIELPEHDTE